MDEALTSAFWKRVAVAGDDECWDWLGSIMKIGYGRIRFLGREIYAHRLSYQIEHGKMTDLHVLHSCDNRRCVNPRHLREGTNADNVRDREDRGRSGDRRGEGNNCSKLTDGDVIEIRTAFASGESTPSIASRYGISKSTAWQVASGNSWRHVPLAQVHSGQTGEEIVVKTL